MVEELKQERTEISQRTERLSPERKALLAQLLKSKKTEVPASEPASADRLPELRLSPGQRYEPFPLTDLQHAYWLGRSTAFEMGALASCAYLELERTELDLARFQRAWQILVQRHDMLRVIVLNDGRQQILPRVPEYQPRLYDLSRVSAEEAERQLESLFREITQELRPTDEWPLFDVRISRLRENRYRLHFRLDMLNFDASSVKILLDELHRLYEHPQTSLPPIEISFREYILTRERLKQTPLYRQAREYWLEKIARIAPAPELPLAKNPAGIPHPRFTRRRAVVDADTWKRLKAMASPEGVTPTGILLTLYADVLSTWCKSPRFTLNIPLFSRLAFHPQVHRLVGDFDTLMLLSIDHAAPMTFRERAVRLQRQIWDDLEHRYMDGVELLREMVRLQGGAGEVKMPLVFTSLLDERFDEAVARLGTIVRAVNQTSQVWLDLHVDEWQDELVIKWDAVDELFPEGMMDDMLAAYVQHIHELANQPERWDQSPRRLLPPEVRHRIEQVNATDDVQPNAYLHTLFLDRAILQPDQIAVIAPDRRMTYGELAQRANRIGHRLRREGLVPNRLAAIVMEKGWQQVAAALGILQAGGAYLPLDPDLPRERLFQILEHAQVRWVLTQSRLADRLELPEGIIALAVDDDAVWNSEPDDRLETVQDFDDLAYVIYTSGSTGTPKGVMIDHRGAVNTLLDVNARFGVNEHDCVLAISALSFDLSVYDLFGMLAAGGTIVIPESAAAREPARWADLLDEHRVTLWNSVPALMQLLVEYLQNHSRRLPESLRLVMMSGDWIPVPLPDMIRAQAPGDIRLISMGGATEASIWSILYPIERVDPSWKSIPYGKPMRNQRFYVLDHELEPRPTWVAGELYIGGLGLAKGYWRDPEKTDTAFITHPVTGERLYRTGDLGRYLPDGHIEFLGRADFQVKIRGFRIELGEIENTLLQHEGVGEAVVMAVGDDAQNRRLVGYVVPEKSWRNGRTGGRLPANVAITDPFERTEFKLRNPGLRELPHRPKIALEPEPALRNKDAYLARQSYRRFRQDPVTAGQLRQLLSCLAKLRWNDLPLPKYRYPSADGLYPVQTYLYLKPGRVEGLPAGFFYYHPSEHALIGLAEGELLDRTVHTPNNFDIFDASAFSLFLVAELKAIQPLYGDAARDLCLLEAGYMGQLLMSVAPECDLGLCPVGGVDFERIRPYLELSESQVYLHGLLGGAIHESQKQQFSFLVECSSSELMAAAQPSSAEPERVLDAGRLRDFAARKLPAYMVPSAFVILDRFPLTANGKVNRKALPVPGAESKPAASPSPVAGPPVSRDRIHQRVAEIVARVLQIALPADQTNLLQLGANSVDMIRIGNELEKEYGTRPRMDEIFRLQSIEALAYYYQEKLNSPQPLSTDTADSQTAALIHRIKNLSREEVQSLLEAKRKRNESIT